MRHWLLLLCIAAIVLPIAWRLLRPKRSTMQRAVNIRILGD